jgi:hypothetical protein
MMLAEYEKFLQSARSLLDRFMFDGDAMRDNVATLCMTIDDVLPSKPLALFCSRAVAGIPGERHSPPSPRTEVPHTASVIRVG